MKTTTQATLGAAVEELDRLGYDTSAILRADTAEDATVAVNRAKAARVTGWERADALLDAASAALRSENTSTVGFARTLFGAR